MEQGDPAAPADVRLAEPPRRIPSAFYLAELLQFRWWCFFVIYVLAVPVAALVAEFSKNARLVGLSPVVVLLPMLAVLGLQFSVIRKRFALLKWGQVAQVTWTQILSKGRFP